MGLSHSRVTPTAVGRQASLAKLGTRIYSEACIFISPVDIPEQDACMLSLAPGSGPEIHHERILTRPLASYVAAKLTERELCELERARGGELDHWADTPRGRLALIIVLDQFSRNIYRGSPLSYSQDEKALKLALEGIDLGMDRELKLVERRFFWLALETSPSTRVALSTLRRKWPTPLPI